MPRDMMTAEEAATRAIEWIAKIPEPPTVAEQINAALESAAPIVEQLNNIAARRRRQVTEANRDGLIANLIAACRAAVANCEVCDLATGLIVPDMTRCPCCGPARVVLAKAEDAK